MFILQLINGYRQALEEGGWVHVDTEIFFLEFENNVPTTSEVIAAVRKHYEPCDLYKTYLNFHLYLTDDKHELKIKDLPNVPIADYGIKSGDVLRVASDMR